MLNWKALLKKLFTYGCSTESVLKNVYKMACFKLKNENPKYLPTNNGNVKIRTFALSDDFYEMTWTDFENIICFL